MTPRDEAGGIIDSEYENLLGMTKDDLWDYLDSGFDLGLTREESDELHVMFGLGG